MNYTDARTILNALTAAWPHTDMPEETSKLWIRALTGHDIETAQAAAESVISTENYFPTIAKFREALSAASRTRHSQWTAAPDCPVCAGTALATDEQGRDWLCRCAVFEQQVRTEPSAVAPPPELLAAARRALPRTLQHPHQPPEQT